ncbi:hypothetical protein JHK82_054782 [Glycine max]|nr:hypothetical protein JHK86_052722 [Glycine max]KAG4927090.1 hypothetical protein JHK85_053576 [Glycine max]KAG5082713.1 hypothetical protein JHK84_052751 [Glycine max]KAG5087385.1 hypothetical protein JHK82_054782 [Glycine max]
MVMSDTVVAMERFSLKGILSVVERFLVTNLAVVLTLVVINKRRRHRRDHYCTSLDDVAHSSMLGYGLTESAVTRITPEEANRVGATGKLIPSIEAKIVNPETGEAMFPGEQGELWIKGPYVMKGYAGDPKATSETLVDGWLRTGDLCYFDNEGFLYVVDRLKELIKYKGYLVAPAELEELLLSHPDINDAAVIP